MTTVRKNLIMTQDAPALLEPALHELWRYWQQLRTANSNSLPQKVALQIAGLRTVLPNIVLSEHVNADTVLIRLAGSAVEAMTNRTLSGVNLLDLTPPEQRTRIGKVYKNLFSMPCGFYISETIRIDDGKKFILSALVLPLADKKGVPCFTVGQYAVSRNGFEEASYQGGAVIEHRQIDQFGYIDIGHGTPS
ncbi:PAS domain-containing protein [Kordiimonas sp.]|uniref:PAS domain-containing protein n=1 Tax=Kordiimonas sp. TaxID=1970157 RepID=UPI003A94EEE9